MYSNKTKILIAIALTSLILTIMSVGVYAWLATSESYDADSLMGKVESAINGTGGASPRLMAMSSAEAAVPASVNKTFNIENTSDIDMFARIGYTLTFKNKGSDVMVDTSNAKIESFNIAISGSSTVTGAKETIKSAGYDKNFLVPITKGGNKYYRIKPGENISGSITISNPNGGQYQADLVISTETIQATEKALDGAKDFGWDKSRFN